MLRVVIVCSKCFICSSLPLQQVISCYKLQVFYLDITYIFTHMLQVYVVDVSSVSDVCCIQVFHVACVSCYSESQGMRGSDGGMARALGNEARRAGGRGVQCAGGRRSPARQGKQMGRGARMGAGRIEVDGVDCEQVVRTRCACGQAN
jgi:hypothetical protein